MQRFTFAITVVTALLVADIAQAEDKKGYHASTCRSADGNDTAFSRTGHRLTRTGSRGNGHVFCPLVFDSNASSASSSLAADAHIRVLDHHSSGVVSCTLSAHQRDGGRLSSMGYQTRDTANVEGSLYTMRLQVRRPPSDGTYSLRCSLPVNGGSNYTKIYSYSLLEG